MHDIFDTTGPAEGSQLASYSVPASVIHSHLVDLLAHGRRTFDQDEPEPPRPILHLLDVGGRFSPRIGGELDSSGSTSQDLSLAQELTRVVHDVEIQQGARDERLDMQDWTRSALDVIIRVEQPSATLEDLAELRPFAERSVLRVLECIMDLPVRAPAE